MPTKKLIALKEVWYAGRTRKPGDAFEATEADAKLLVGFEKATLGVQDPPAEKSGRLHTTALEAKDDPSSEKTGRRRYGRRDMRAED